MANYTPRLTAPDESNAYFYKDNPFYQSGYGLPNCTCYAFGRFWEIGGGDMPSLSWGNAEDWYGHSDGYERGTTPKLGAVLCWRRGVAGDNSDGAGHVAIVEQINDDGTIVTSESGWDSALFWTTKRDNSDGKWNGSAGNYFQGFIYNPAVDDSGSTSDDRANSRYIWNYFIDKIGNAYGVAGLLGNLDAESGLYPDRVQGDIPYSDYSKEYTADVDSGAISEYDFVHNGPNGGGYGLAQWTFYTRKQALYDMYESGGYSSIGSMLLACDYLWYELQHSFASVLDALKKATSVREASDVVLHDFESPSAADEKEEQRAAMSQTYYDLYANTTPTPTKKRKGLPLLLLWAATRRD